MGRPWDKDTVVEPLVGEPLEQIPAPGEAEADLEARKDELYRRLDSLEKQPATPERNKVMARLGKELEAIVTLLGISR